MTVAGVDLGGTKISVAVVDGEGRVLDRTKQPARKSSLEETVEQVAELAGGHDVSAIGLCVPGIYFPATGNAWAPNLWGWEEVPLRRALEERLRVPITIDSDRAAYVVGEQWRGAARGLGDVVFLAVGTGIGAGILSGGRLIRGADDIAGAVGWFALDPRKEEIYGQLGCFEAEAAGPAVARRGGAANAEAVVEAARRGDAQAMAVLEETARWLGMGIANLVSLLNPRMVVLGGGLMQAGDLLLERIRSEMLEWAQPIAARRVRIELSELGEDAGVLGAARLALIEHDAG